MHIKTAVMLNGLLLTFTMVYSGIASAHGTMFSPVSRAYQCYLEGPENTQSEACQAAVAAGGKSALYNWSAISQNAGGDDLAFVPDGKLCSGGNESYKGFDLARADWPKTEITGPDIDFSFRGTAPHATKRWSYYITKDSYNPNQALEWDDLEPLCEFGSINLEDGLYNMSCALPDNKSGEQIIYSVWERSDSQETFYTCMDVTITSDEANENTDNNVSTDSNDSSDNNDNNDNSAIETPIDEGNDTVNPPVCTEDAFVSGTHYQFEDLVLHNNSTFSCLVSGWCSSETDWAYEPGVGLYWQDAWLETQADCSVSNSETSEQATNEGSTDDSVDDSTEETTEKDIESTLFDIAQIVATSDLPEGSSVTLRLFNSTSGTESLMDSESFSLLIAEGRGAKNQWPFDLANIVNQSSVYIVIGQMTAGEITPVESDNDNRVYSMYENLHVELEFVSEAQTADTDTTPEETMPEETTDSTEQVAEEAENPAVEDTSDAPTDNGEAEVVSEPETSEDEITVSGGSQSIAMLIITLMVLNLRHRFRRKMK